MTLVNTRLVDDAPPIWTDICPVGALVPERGAAALVAGQQVAIFLVDDVVHAVDNLDPKTGAAVMSRGLVGSAGHRLTLASPVYKQRYDLETGQCLDEPDLRLGVWPVRLVDGRVEIGSS